MSAGLRTRATVACIASLVCLAGVVGSLSSTAANGAAQALSPSGWGGAAGSRPDTLSRPALAAWFDSARVQGHTRLPLEHWRDRPAFRDAASRMLSLGLRVFTRAVKPGMHSPFVLGPDASPASVRLGRDSTLLRSVFAGAHRAGQHTIAYVWISSDSAVADRHPEWVCRGPNRRMPARAPRGTPLDVTSPYREVILAELEALAREGADGFFFDWSHLPPDGCWSPHLVRGFEEATGRSAPRRRDAHDPTYRAFLAYQARQLDSTLAYLRDALHRDHPGVVFVVSVATLPTLMDLRAPVGLATVGDVPKTEFLSPVRPAFGGWTPTGPDVPRDVRLAAGWTLVRDAAAGRPPLVWALGFPDSTQAMGFVAAVLTHGGIASLDVADRIAAGSETAPHATPVPALRAAASLGDRVSRGLAGKRPSAWAGIHFPEAARDRLMGDPDRAWLRVVLPALRAYETLLRARVPVRFVTDAQLAGGGTQDLKVLVLPDSGDLDAVQKAHVAAFRRAGGQVMSAQDAAASYATAVSSGMRVLGGPATLHVGFFADRGGANTTILLTPDFSWVEPVGLRVRPGRVRPLPGPEPAPVTGVVIRLGAGAPPRRVRDLVTGEDLPVSRTEGGYEVRVPPFRILSAIEMIAPPHPAAGPARRLPRGGSPDGISGLRRSRRRTLRARGAG